jgi:putative tryptophan/tyrosine transport system substrate-binding protein
MRRREFVTLLAGAATSWPLTTRAQQPALPVVGWLRAGGPPDGDYLRWFRQGLNELGYVDVTSGVNLTENHRFEFPHFAANVDLRRIAGGVWAFSCPTTLVATCTLDRRPR